MNKLAKKSYAKLATFNHKEHAERLDQLNTQAQAARRVDVALGLYCFELKEIHLLHGQFGRWLAEHKPNLVRQDHATGEAKASRSLETSMSIAKSALEVCGYTVMDFIALLQKQIPRARGISDAGQLMLLPEAKLPEEFKALRDDIFSLVDGKSQRQLLSEFKQVDDDGKAKRGRAKGCKGTTAEQHAAAREAERLAHIEDTELRCEEFITEANELADDTHLGVVSEKHVAAVTEAVEVLRHYLTTLRQRRSTGNSHHKS